MMSDMPQDQASCPVEITLSLLGNKWKILILRELFSGTKRFGELSRGISGISQKMLTQQLRQMELDSLVTRRIFAEIPPRVEYSLTDVGRSLSPILDAMHKWGTQYQTLNRDRKVIRTSQSIAGKCQEDAASPKMQCSGLVILYADSLNHSNTRDDLGLQAKDRSPDKRRNAFQRQINIPLIYHAPCFLKSIANGFLKHAKLQTIICG